MKNSLIRICVIIFFLVAIISAGAGCGKKETTTTGSPGKPLNQSYSGGLVTAIADAATEKESVEAVKDIVSQGYSLGLLDANGKQLNPNVPENAVSLSPVAVDMYASMDVNGNFRTVEYVVGFLADAGVELESTGAVITVRDFLPALQKYVDRSFSHPDDPKSVLGLMIASGQDMKVPASPPTITGQTMISPLCSLMIMGDVLLGVESEDQETSASRGSWFAKKALAADSGDDVVQRIRGLIATIKPLMGPLGGLLPEKAQRIMAAFETCDRLSVRMWEVPDSSIAGDNWNNVVSKTLPVTKNLKLEKGKKESITVLGGTGLMAGVSGSPLETLEGIQTTYRFQLLSDNDQGTGVPLYDDVDAELRGYTNAFKEKFTYSSDLGGHRLLAEGKGNYPFVLAVKTMSNEGTRRALLHASAYISPPDNLYQIAEQRIIDKVGKDSWASLIAMGALDTLPWNQIKEIMTLLKRDFQPTPWMCIVEFGPVEKKETSTTTTTQAPKPSAPDVRITSPKEGATIIEGETIIISLRAVDYLGEPLPEKLVNDNAQWELDDGTYLVCTPLGDGDFEVSKKLTKGLHKITVSIPVNYGKNGGRLTGTDYVNINIVPEQLSPSATILKKNWTLYLNYEGRTADYEIFFREDGTFFFMNDSWKATWTLDGSAIKMSISYDYKSGPNMVKHLELDGVLVAAEDGDYRNATMRGKFTEWNDWEKEKSMKNGTWTAD